MEKTTKIKLFIGLTYLVIVGVFLYYLFSYFTLQQLTSYSFIKDNVDYFSQLKKSNLLFLSLAFLLFTILWVYPCLGFGSPIALLGGFLFGKILGSFIVILGLSIGATFLYIFASSIRFCCLTVLFLGPSYIFLKQQKVCTFFVKIPQPKMQPFGGGRKNARFWGVRIPLRRAGVDTRP